MKVGRRERLGFDSVGLGDAGETSLLLLCSWLWKMVVVIDGYGGGSLMMIMACDGANGD
ncbi:hypothetical protein TSUD_131550 [Trifolium subterraneum]|uniref:Uncharacterized protein n=1 Tax=Trifolium subterraneum TaxID=3900 RepID=A0A2Z6P3K9_TRISU|nr:hypothetical protein TSUD_131550 [Trifolium subterraneum]